MDEISACSCTTGKAFLLIKREAIGGVFHFPSCFITHCFIQSPNPQIWGETGKGGGCVNVGKPHSLGSAFPHNLGANSICLWSFSFHKAHKTLPLKLLVRQVSGFGVGGRPQNIMSEKPPADIIQTSMCKIAPFSSNWIAPIALNNLKDFSCSSLRKTPTFSACTQEKIRSGEQLIILPTSPNCVLLL